LPQKVRGSGNYDTPCTYVVWATRSKKHWQH